MLDRLIESISLTKFDIVDMSTFDKDGLIIIRSYIIIWIKTMKCKV